ncbi:hypothetical protein [Psychrobacter phenylpyruvicus]|nr:hypothetical protein [Psychrobacter phenylpyruvicus]
MIRKHTTLRLMILASMPSIGSLSLAAFAAVPSTSNNSVNNDITTSQRLKPSLVGVVVNGQEVDAIDILYDARVNDLPVNETISSSTQTNHYYFVSIDDLSRLTGVVFEPIAQTNETSSATVSSTQYLIKTPIGDAQIAENSFIKKDNKNYLALSSLKKLGITADYNQADLAISLNMGWLPENIKNDSSPTRKASEKRPIDYYPSKAGILGLSFDSSVSIAENNTAPNQPQSTSRSVYANLGAFGYGLGGVWGAKAVGMENHSEKKSNNNFTDIAIDGFSTLPSDWEIDNLYWAKSGKNIATRLGTSQPNALGQGAQTSGSEFTGALVAYSNRDINRHLAYFDDNSSSLLQNTNQDYQHIIGVGEPGGVAELRIDGRTIARVQIGLDGRYEFLNLDVNQLNLIDNLVEIAIFAYPLARQPLEVRPVFLGKRRTNAATNELLLEAGFGRAGNAFNSNDNNNDTAAHIYAEYGLSNRLAIRGGANTNLQNSKDDDDSISWHTGLNYTPSAYSNIDLSYANTPSQNLWQAQIQYNLAKLWANYQYNLREYDSTRTTSQGKQRDQLHQLFLNYQPSSNTSITLNQYYEDIANIINADNYYAYAGVNHQFSPSMNGGLNWDTRGDRYNYRLSWQDINRKADDNRLTRNTVGLSGDNDSDTVSLRHQFSDQTSLGQSISYRHGQSDLLYQGDINHRMNGMGLSVDNTSPLRQLSSILSLGYSLYDNKVGWQADWQLIHQNSVNFSLGYKHKYVDSISTDRLDGLLIDEGGFIRDNSLPAWTQNNYLYARLSFDMFKAPKQGLKLGNYPRQNLGSVIVDIAHPAEPQIGSEAMTFTLDNQKVDASLLGSSDTSSQYLISNIKAGEYTLNMDAKDLPLEYSTVELPTPRIRVANYSPTSVPINLQKTYGISGKLASAKQDIEIGIYQGNQLIQSTTSGSFGYFQMFGLPSATYTLKSPGYQEQQVVIDDDFVMQIVLQPTD